MVRRGRSTETGAARGNLPAPAGQKGMDRKVGKQGEETAGHTSSQGSCGASGTAACAGADLRKRLRSAQLRVSAGESAQQALARVEMKLREGFHWVVDADLKSYFD